MGESGGTTVTPEQVTQHHLGSVFPRKGDDWHASLGLMGNNLFVLCPALQLARMTWWTRHRKAPAIDLKNYKSAAAEINPANGEIVLVESADSGDKEEAGRVAVCEQAHSCAYECTAKISCRSFQSLRGHSLHSLELCVFTDVPITNGYCEK